MYTKGKRLGFSVSSGTLKTNTYEPIPLEEELIKISSFNSITANRSLCLIKGYCSNKININDIHQMIVKYYLIEDLIFEGMYLDFRQLHCDSIIICPYLCNVSMEKWNDKSFAKEQFNKLNGSILKLILSICVQFCCLSLFILLLVVSIGIYGDKTVILLGIWCTFILSNIAFLKYIWSRPYRVYLSNIRHKYILLHFNSKDGILEKWRIKPHKISGNRNGDGDNNQYVMKLQTIEKICTFQQIRSITCVPSGPYSKSNGGWIKLWKDVDDGIQTQTKKILYQIPKGFGSIVKRRLKEFIMIYLTDD